MRPHLPERNRRVKHAMGNTPRSGQDAPMSMPLLLLPGLLCDARLWRDCIPGAAHARIADLSLDDGVAAMAARAIALMEDAPHFAVAGLSMGGYVAFEVIRQAAPRISRLALLDTSARSDTPEQTQRRRSLISLAETGRFRGVTPRLLPQLIHPSRLGAPLATEVLEMAARVGPDAFLRQQQAIMSRPDSRPLLPGIAIPTLVAVGESDILTPPELAQEMAAGIKGARLVRFPGCGHLPTMEDPEATRSALESWLARA
jgi:pimeloyl-ACP methyl ester carboxylesterase